MSRLNDHRTKEPRTAGHQDNDNKGPECSADGHRDLPAFTEHHASQHDSNLSSRAVDEELERLSLKTIPPPSGEAPEIRKRPNDSREGTLDATDKNPRKRARSFLPPEQIALGVSSPEPRESREKIHAWVDSQPAPRQLSQEDRHTEAIKIHEHLSTLERKARPMFTKALEECKELNNAHWIAFTELYGTLLKEYGEFFLTSQHPSAKEETRRLAERHNMSMRLWDDCIEVFLKPSRDMMPQSYDHMLVFINYAYGMFFHLYEMVPAFKVTWSEYLGHLSRSRMVMDQEYDQSWIDVARQWYSLASDNAPTTGRLYQSLAILAQPTQKLWLYTKSLCVLDPCPTTRQSIMTLFDPILNGTTRNMNPVDTAFVKVHAILFSGKSVEQLEESIDKCLSLLDQYLRKVPGYRLESSVAIPLACAIIGYGNASHFMMKLLFSHLGGPLSATHSQAQLDPPIAASPENKPDNMFQHALKFNMKAYGIIVKRQGDLNTLPFIHTFLIFIFYASRFPDAMAYIEYQFPWTPTATMLNYLYQTCSFKVRMDSKVFPGPQKNKPPRPLPEDFKVRGLLYAENLYPENWYRDARVEEDAKEFELPSMADQRKERILWLGRRLALSGKWLTWDESAHQFGVAESFATSGVHVKTQGD